MNANFVASNWALIAAAGILAPVVFLVVLRLAGRSAAGQLRNTRAELAHARRKLARSQAAGRRAEAKVDRLLKKPANVKPRVLHEARESLADARELEKIAADRVLVAENHVRRVIHEEYPPAKQERLRKKCLPGAPPPNRPFSF